MKRAGARISSLLVILCVLSTSSISLFAQTSTSGAVEGRVYEEGTALGVPSATITIVNQETGLTRTSLTGPDGRYFIATLPPGFYRLSASAPGFEPGVNASASNFPITITQTKKVQPPPIALRRIGAVPQTPGTTPPGTQPPVTQPGTQPPVTQPGTQPGTQPTGTLPVGTQGQTTADQSEVVSEFAQSVNTVNASRGGSFTRREILLLPLPGIRTFDDLAFLLPGVAPPPQPIGTNVGPGLGPGVGTSGQFSVNGLRSRANNFTIDGSDNNDEEVGVRRQGFTTLVPQPIESIQEFQITTLLPEPQFGRNMAAQVNAVSRSGGNSFHGTLYGFITDKRLKATDPFDLTGGPSQYSIFVGGRPVFFNLEPLVIDNPVDGENPFTRLQYGFVLGGPIVKQKTHFFVSFEHQDINASRESHFAVPGIPARGLFGSGATGLDASPDPQILTPTFPTSLTGNAFFSLYPFPNNPLGPYRDNTYTEILPANADGMILSGKIDHLFRGWGQDHTLSARYNFTDDDTILPVTGEAIFSSLRALVRTQNLSVILNSPLSNRASNQFRVSYGRTTLGFEEVRNPNLIPSKILPDVPFLLNVPLVLNATLPNGNISFTSFPEFGLDSESGLVAQAVSGFRGTGPLGQIKISGYSPVGVDVFSFPQGRTNNTFQFADTVVVDMNRHRLTFGADIRWIHLNSFLDRNFRPLAVFSGARNLNEDENGNLIPLVQGEPSPFLFGTDFAAVGAPTGFFQSQALTPDSSIELRYWQNNFFFSDQIRVRPNFTLTLGLRYELNTVPKERDRKIESTFGSTEVAQLIEIEKVLNNSFPGGSPVSGLEEFLDGRTDIFGRDNNNFAPHIAFAWDPFEDGKTSIRAGYGIYYDQILGAVISQSRNVFPNFLPVNLAGLGVSGVIQPLVSVNPAQFVVPGTLNTFDRTRFPGGPVALLFEAMARSNFSSGPAFVLPASDLETPYAQHWTLTFERDLNKGFLMSAGYVGTRGVHLLRFTTPNLGPNVIPVATDVFPEIISEGNARFIFPNFAGLVIPPSLTPGEDFRPFPALGPITIIESDANSTYHSLQLQLMKRFSHGVQFTTAYTWSHAIDEVSDLFDMAGAPALPQNSFDREAERADANFDVRHRFSYSFIWDLPILRGNRVLGGWQLASIGTFQTGQPYSVLFCCDANLDGNLTDRVSLQGGAPAAPGSTPRNIFRAPGIATVDMALNKVFRISEGKNIEFRTEVFNVFNRTHYGIPVNQIFFGGLTTEPLTDRNNYINTRVPKRTIQFAAKFNF